MEEPANAVEVTSRDYARVLFRQKAVIITCMLTVMATVVVGVYMKTDVYQAQVKMLLSGKKEAQAGYYTDIASGGMRSDQITLTQTEIVASDPVIERAVSALGLAHKPFDYEIRFCSRIKRPLVRLWASQFSKKLEGLTQEQKDTILFRLAMEDLRKRLKVEPVRDTDLFLIKVTDFNPLGAAVTANIVSRSYAMFDMEQQLAEMKLKYGEKNQAVVQLRQALEKMNEGLSGQPLPHLEAIGPASVKIIEQAKVPMEPEGLPRIVLIILAFFMAVFLSVVLAFTFEYMDQTFKTPADALAYLGIPCLGTLGRRPKTVDSRAFFEQLYMSMKEKKGSFIFASAYAHDGALQILSGLAGYLSADLNKKVLVVDLNVRAPLLHKALGLPESNDLLDIVEVRTGVEREARSVGPNLQAVTSGSAVIHLRGIKRLVAFLSRKPLFTGPSFNPVSLLESPKTADFIKQAKARYDLVLCACSPIAEAKDALICAGLCDSVIFVVSEGLTRRQSARHALELLKARSASLVGFVLTNRTMSIPKAIYHRL